MQYVFLDESGNLDFTLGGSRFFVLTAMSVTKPLQMTEKLNQLKYSLWGEGLELEYFHAAQDRQATRDRVFAVISQNLGDLSIDSVVVEKRKTNPALQRDHGRFYSRVFEVLLNYILNRHRQEHRIVFVCDTIPVQERRRAVEKGIKSNLSTWAELHANEYNIYFVASKSDCGLQVADYVCWAISRKWERRDTRSYELVRQSIRSEFDVFRTGSKFYY